MSFGNMFNSAQFTTGIEIVNDERAFKLPYKLCGKMTHKIMLNRYMKIDVAEKGNIIYPQLISYLS